MAKLLDQLRTIKLKHLHLENKTKKPKKKKNVKENKKKLTATQPRLLTLNLSRSVLAEEAPPPFQPQHVRFPTHGFDGGLCCDSLGWMLTKRV